MSANRTESEKEKVIKAIKNGLSYKEIKEQFGFATAAVARLKKKYGLNCEHRGRQHKHERLTAHYYFTAPHMADTFIENSY